jgi:Spy/CpxP family protein refolding chaperone
MKRNLITLAVVGAIALGGFIVAQAETGGHRGHEGFRGRHGGFGLERLTEGLDLTPDQQAKVQPLIDQAKPQIVAIHEEAMQKTHAVMDKAMSQIRPLLTPEQQKKFDDIQKAQQDMRSARKKMHDAVRE